MATRATTFTAKIQNLKEYYNRLVNNTSPFPSGVDIANTLKYFSQTLLSVLKDVPSIPLESYGPRQRDSVRLSVFPNLKYSGLYTAVMNIIDVVPMVTYGQTVLAEAILNVLGCLVPFLEYDLLDSLPYTVASTLAFFPAAIHKDAIDLICTNLLPITLGYAGMNENPTYATDSTAAIIMMVFQYIEKAEYHSQLLECLMSFKRNVCKDLLSVIAYGPPTARTPAVNHLFHYWPQLNPALTDRRGIHYKYLAWQAVSCQRESCPNSGNVQAVKMCLDPAIAIQCGDKPPPLYICGDCVGQVLKDHAQYLVDVLLPLEKVSLICENKNCTSPKNRAVATCFSIECASMNGNHPIRYCATCHGIKHNTEAGFDHMVHCTIPDVWSAGAEMQGYLVEAIVSLLKEAQPMEEKRVVEMGEERMRQQHFEDEEDVESDESEERKLLSRYGIWLLVELCKPQEDVPIEILGRLLAMLFQWFDATAYLPDDNVGNALERLKPEYVCKWLKAVMKTHFEVILSCLLPHPVEYARVGGHWETSTSLFSDEVPWDTLSSRTSQIKEGLNRLFCLVPYDIVTFEVWDYVMPFWLEAIRTEVPEDEMPELKVLLCKIFDIDMCPLSFGVDKMYHFVVERFDRTPAAVQEQSLAWLQILSSLEILIPLPQLMSMFTLGVEALQNPPPEASRADPQSAHSTQSRSATDDFAPGSPLSPSGGQTFNFDGQGNTESEPFEVQNITCLLMILDLLLKQVELQEATPNLGIYNDTSKGILNLLSMMLSTPWQGKHICDDDDEVTDCNFCQVSALWFQLAAQVMEFVAPRDELKLPEKDLPKVDELPPRAVSNGQDKKKKSAEKKPASPEELEYDVSNLAVHLKLLNSLLVELDNQQDADALYFLLEMLRLLCLHGECLNYAVTENKAFSSYALRKNMIPNLWKLLQAEHSQIASVSVPLLLHSITLPDGFDIFWKIVEDEFTNEDWRARFSAVEKTTVLARLIKPEAVENNQLILTSLAHAFCNLIGALNDVNSAVVQRTILYLETIKTSAVKCICTCLDFQFDSVINDRTMILQRLALLAMILKNQDILTWDFFLNRFDTLSLEAQLDLESSGDIASLTDLTSSDKQSDHFLRKLNRARFAMARTDSIRSVSSSLCAKPPYRRAASVPHHLVAKTTAVTTQKEKRPALSRWKQLMYTVNFGMATSYAGSRAGEEEDINRLKHFLTYLLHQAVNPLTGLPVENQRKSTIIIEEPIQLRRKSADQLTPSCSTERRGSFGRLKVEPPPPAPRRGSGGLLKVERAPLQRKRSKSLSKDLPPGASALEELVKSCLPPDLRFQIQEKDKTYPRQQSAPQFGRRDPRGSKLGLSMFGNYMFPGGHLREFTDEESNFAALLQRAMDLEGVDRETVHLLVTLLMKFMARCDQEKVEEDRDSSRAQNVVLRHLNILLGYNQTEKAFSVPPYKLRSSTVFNAYLSGLPQVLDCNFQLGNLILPVSLLLLQYSPSPQRYASDYQPPNYTLWYLEPHARQSWLKSLIVILYKYQYNTSPASGIIQTLVRITMNTIDAQHHRCKRHDEAFGPASPVVPRNRADTSNVSIGDLENIQETDTPPQSPTDSQRSAGGTEVSISMISPSTGTVQFRKRPDSEKTEETDVESLSPTSKVASPGTKMASSSAKADSSDTDSPVRSVSPGFKSTKVSSPSKSTPLFKLGSPIKEKSQHKTASPPRVGSPTEALALLQRDQPRRLAEYDSGSGHERTLEQSVEEYVMQQVTHPKDGSTDPPAKKPLHVTESYVARKMVDQIQQFESLNEARKRDTFPRECPPPADTVILISSDEAEKEDLPKPDRIKLARPPLGKTKSAGTLTTGDEDKEKFSEGLRASSERELSSKTQAGDELQLPDSTMVESEIEDSPLPSPSPTPKIRPNFRPRKPRKTGLTTVELQKMIPELADLGSGSDIGSSRSPKARRARKADLLHKASQQSLFASKRSSAAMRYGDHALVDRCPQCNAVLEQYDEDTISMCIVALSTFIHREPSLAAPLLLDMLQTVARIASSSPYPWQQEISVNLIIPGNSVSVARQFLRCVLYQLAPNGVFPQLFQSSVDNPDFLKTVAMSLVDFSELNCHSALLLLLEGINNIKNITSDTMVKTVTNLATFMDCIAVETNTPAGVWSNILTQFDTFFRRLPATLPSPCDMGPVLKIMIAVLKIPVITSVKGILEPFSRVLSFTLQNCTFKLQQLLDICSLSSRAFTKERDKLFLSRSVVFELVQALKFKSTLPDENLLMLVQFVVMDAGGTICPSNITDDLTAVHNAQSQALISTNAAECMKAHLNECVEFIADLHTLTKVKNNLKGCATSLNEDTLGSQLKSGISQFIALEFTKGNGRDNRAISRYLPWLYHPPSAMQQGPKEFIDCVGHIRLLSWLLLGSLTHVAITKSSGLMVCQPIPLEASCHIADHIMVIMTGFAEQSKASVLHMSSLFHAFILCQLWTMYCESFAALSPAMSESYLVAHGTIMDFWGRVTPGVLQLLSHSKVLAEMVNLHFLSLMEALQECNSTVLSKLFPMWIPILFTYHVQLPGHMQVRLQKCQNWEPVLVKGDTSGLDSLMLLKWLQRLQFKLGQIEVQSSAATQFYTV